MGKRLVINGKELKYLHLAIHSDEIVANRPYISKRVEGWHSYWYITDNLEIVHDDAVACFYGENRYKVGNYYKTREDAQHALDVQLAITKINDKIYELQDGEVEHGAGKDYMIVHYVTGFEYTRIPETTNLLHWMTKKTVKYIIENYQDELKLIMGIKTK